MSSEFDSILILSFGGPEGPADVIPFLENVLRGRNVPRERLEEVAKHYQQFGGKSPINDQNRALIAALEAVLGQNGPKLPVYFGNRNWNPLLPDTLREMQADGCKNAVAFFTSIFSSYSGCRQYRENIEAAQKEIGEGAPKVSKVRMSYNHPAFIEVMQERVQEAKAQLPAEVADSAVLVFTAHSIPLSMAKNCAYESHFAESSGLVAAGFPGHRFVLAYQSRSGSPHSPWLEPDILGVIKDLHAEGVRAVITIPIGFVSDHMEVIYDLDVEAKTVAAELNLPFARAGAAGTHPKFISMIRDLILERTSHSSERPCVGTHGPCHDVCPANCCLPGEGRPPARPGAPSPGGRPASA
jgi:ferrochelatase